MKTLIAHSFYPLNQIAWKVLIVPFLLYNRVAMPEGTGSPEQGQREPQYKEEILQYADGQLGIFLTGDAGAE